MTKDDYYFRLYGDVILLKNGKSNEGMLYQLVENKMFSLQPPAVAVLEAFEKNLSVEAVAKKIGRKRRDIVDFLNILQKVGAGSFFHQPYYIEKIRSPNPLSSKVLFREPVQLHRLHVYLTNNCTMNCWYCGKTGISRLRPCGGCGNIPGLMRQKMQVDWNILKRTLNDASELEFSTVAFHIGDPAINKTLVINALQLAHGCHFRNIELFVGGGVEGQILETVIKTNATVIFQVYSGNAERHDLECGCTGKFVEIKRSIKSLSEAGKSFALTYLIPPSANDIEPSIKSLVNLCQSSLILDRILTRTLLDNVNEIGTLADDCINIPDVASYIVSLERNCMYGQFSLSYDNYLYACPFITSTAYGHAMDTSIADILESEKEQSFWRDGVITRMDCQECQVRLACNLCPAARSVGTEEECAIASKATSIPLSQKEA